MEQGESVSVAALTDLDKVKWMLSLPNWQHKLNRRGTVIEVKSMQGLSKKEISSLACGYDFVKKCEDEKNNGVL